MVLGEGTGLVVDGEGEWGSGARDISILGWRELD